MSYAHGIYPPATALMLAVLGTACAGNASSVDARSVDTGPTVTTLASGQARPWGIAINATHVYWTSSGDGRVSRVAKAGGPVETLAIGQVSPRPIAIDDEFAYWGNAGVVYRAPITGGQALSFAAGPAGTVDAITLTSSDVIWLSTSAGVIARANKEFIGTPSVFFLAEAQAAPVGLVADDSRVFWANQGDGTIWWKDLRASLPIANPLLTDVAAGPGKMALDANSIFWVGQADGSVRKVPQGGGAPSQIATGASGNAFIASVASRVYFTNDDSGEVISAPKIGGTATVIATGLDQPLGIAGDSSGIYVATATSIVRLEI